MQNYFEDIYEALFKWISKNSFMGYDPYDALNTEIYLLKKSRNLRLLVTYFHKFCPFNLRQVFKISTSKNCKALALICLALNRYPLKSSADEIISHLIDYILSKSLKEQYGHYCWNAQGFAIQTPREYQLATMPGIIGTEVCASAIFEYYKKDTKHSDLVPVLLSVKDFFLKRLLIRTDNATFFRYKPLSPEHECIYNASLTAASYIARINSFFRESNGDEVCKECYQYVVSKQNFDGSWYYGVDLRNNSQKQQIDFHQGYILDAIWDYLTLGNHDKELLQAYHKGLEFYFSKQFDSNGMSRYRYPRKYPVDIHNQAQGIITFSKAGLIDEKFLKFAQTIADWTINNMQDDSGYFYYLKYPFMTNKIPYMRWGQAWMFNALSHVLHYSREGNNS